MNPGKHRLVIFMPEELRGFVMNQDKRRHRELKREIKRAGNRKRRQHLKRDLAENPEEAAHTDFDFGRASSSGLNGIDRDSTRRKNKRED